MKRKLGVGGIGLNQNAEFPELPNEMWGHLVQFFSRREKASVGQTCKRLLSICVQKYDFSKIKSEATLFEDSSLSRLCLSPDGSMFATLSEQTESASIILYNPEDKRAITLKGRDGTKYKQIAFTFDSQRIIASGSYLDPDNEDDLGSRDAIDLLDIKSGQVVGSYIQALCHEIPIFALQDNNKSMTIDDGSLELVVYDFSTHQREAVFSLPFIYEDQSEHFSGLGSIAISKNRDRFLVQNCKDQTLSIYSIKAKDKILHTSFAVKTDEEGNSLKHSFNFISKDTQLLYIEPGNLCILGINDGVHIKIPVDGLGRGSTYSLSKDEKFIAISNGCYVHLIDLERKAYVLTIDCKAHIKEVTFTPDNESLLTLDGQSLRRYQFEALELEQYLTPEHSRSTFSFSK